MSFSFSLKPAAKAMLVLSTLSVLMVATPARAAIDMFMKISTLNGSTLDPEFAPKKASDLLAWSWGLSKDPSSNVNFQDFNWTQYIDGSFTGSFLGLANGTHFATATMSARNTGSNPFVFLTLTFKDVVLTSMSAGGSGGEDRFTVNYSLRPLSQISVSFTPTLAGGLPGTKQTAVWNLAAGAVTSFSGNPNALAGLYLAGPGGGSNFTGLTTPVPEAQTWLMFGVGLGGLAWVQRRRQRASARAVLPA